jgi:ABC-type polysaccharide/polyol phosphate transport system ATPase subunit
VGDAAFQTKCFDKVREFRRRGKMLLCVSHSSGMIEELCDRAIWLDHGEIFLTGRVSEVMQAYTAHPTNAAV